MHFRLFYFLISGLALVLSFFSISTWGFKFSIDFTGGSLVEYRLPTADISPQALKVVVSTKTEYEAKETSFIEEGLAQLKFPPEFTNKDAETLSFLLADSLSAKPELVRFETVGPVLSKEILNKTYIAIGIAALGILLWVAFQFKSLKLGIMAILAVAHDLIILLGVFSFLGKKQGVEVDVLFVTAMLTVFSLSLYDTIVVYDRIRESSKKLAGMGISFVANRAVTDVIVRSLNTSITTALVLFALFLMGGSAVKWFVLALLVGVISGTYSSPFVAVPLLVSWEELRVWVKSRKHGGEKQN